MVAAGATGLARASPETRKAVRARTRRAVDLLHRLDIGRRLHGAARKAGPFGFAPPRRSLARIEGPAAAAGGKRRHGNRGGEARYEKQNSCPHGPQLGPRV